MCKDRMRFTIYDQSIRINIPNMTKKSSTTEHTLDSEPRYLDNDFMHNSSLYKEFLAERDEILKHKWIESEKAGNDIGFEKALLDWIQKHRSNWRNFRKNKKA